MGTSVNANGIAGEVQDLAAPANVSIAQTSSLGQNGNPGTGPFTASCTLSGTPTAGNSLVVAVGAGNGTTSFSVSSWAGSPGWAFTFSDAGDAAVAIGSIVSDGATKAFTVTCNGAPTATDIWIAVSEVAALRNNPLDHTTTGGQTAVSTTGAIALAANRSLNEIAFVAVAMWGGSYWTSPGMTGGFTPLVSGDSGGTGTDKTSFIVGYQIYTTQSTPGTTVSWTNTGDQSYVFVSYAGLANPTPPQLVATQTIVTSSTRH